MVGIHIAFFSYFSGQELDLNVAKVYGIFGFTPNVKNLVPLTLHTVGNRPTYFLC